eukprot:TRINITY_DN2094_c0_g2_i1.p1 TRINITY_DN2094_c0_g2~~TRINITY_DN2094_c0_g2_i1.p1  ORF type:complete len:230 (+),score=50.46 TRINITY_DN2094_c0_g2_i1:31-720(+)
MRFNIILTRIRLRKLLSLTFYFLLSKCVSVIPCFFFFFFQAEDGIRDAQESRGLGDVYKRQKMSKDTRLLFCTTGVMLRQLAEDPSLAGVSHVFIDEVHERSIESDFLLAALKGLITTNKSLRVIMMSATSDAALYCSYFENHNVGSVEIAGTTFPVADIFLEEVLGRTGFTVDRRGAIRANSPWWSDNGAWDLEDDNPNPNSEDSHHGVQGEGAVSYTHLTLPTKRIV